MPIISFSSKIRMNAQILLSQILSFSWLLENQLWNQTKYCSLLKKNFVWINSLKLNLSFEKLCSIEVDPLIANIAIYNDSLTLTSVIFTTFLHFARKFRMLSEKPFTHFLLCLCKRIVSGLIFLQFSSKIRQKLLPLASFEFLLQLWGKKNICLRKDFDFI